MSKKSIWWILGVIGVIVIIFFIWQYVTDMQKALQIEKQNLAYAQDSLRTSQTDLGFIFEKYARVIDENDTLVQAYDRQGKDLVVLQNVNLQLTLQLESDTASITIDTLRGVFTAVFENKQSDEGLIVFWKDSVIFYQYADTSKWAAINFPDINILMWYNMIIYRDKDGLLSGALETFSPSLKASLLETIIVDDYIPSLPPILPPSTFAITAGGSYYYANIGLFLRLGKWAVNPSYNFLLSNADVNGSPWYKRLDIRLAYFIF